MKNLIVSASQPEGSKKKNDLFRMISFLVIMAGSIKTIFSGFPSIAQEWWIYTVCCAGSSLFLFPIFKTKKKDWMLPAGFMIITVIFFLNKNIFQNGLSILANDFTAYLTGQTGKIYLEFPEKTGGGEYLAAAAFVAVLALLMSFFILMKRSILCILVTVFCCVGCITGLFKTDYGVVLLIIGNILLMTGKEYENISMTGLVSAFVQVCIIMGVCMLPVLLFLPVFNYENSFQKEIYEWENKLHKIRYHVQEDGMPEGNLINMGAYHKTDDIAVIVKTKKPQKLYLRGKTGEAYTGISWEEFESQVYQTGEDLFYWLHKLEFYGQTTIADAAVLMGEADKLTSMEITNKDGCREYFYIPYGLADKTIPEERQIGDDRAYATKDTITFQYYPGNLPKWYEIAVWMTEHQTKKDVLDYIKKEEAYRKFVYQNNLQLTNTVVGVFENMFTNERRDEKSLSEILDLVRNTLEKEITYDEEVITYNGENDFIKYTLEQSKRGYSPHYATVATMMLRYFGVPSRYVEGYFLSTKEAAAYEPDEEMILTHGHAHAWTEYYMDGIGWIPFEVTPGYIDDEEWEAAGMVIADGKGESAGRGYSASTLTYKPPKLPENITDRSNLQSFFRFETRYLFYILGFLLVFLVLILLIIVLRRYLRLKQFRKRIVTAENREAATELYAYGIMLTERLKLVPLWKQDMEREAEQINEWARFSKKEIEDEHRRVVEEFVKEIESCCKKQCNLWQKFMYHLILWIY